MKAELSGELNCWKAAAAAAERFRKQYKQVTKVCIEPPVVEETVCWRRHSWLSVWLGHGRCWEDKSHTLTSHTLPLSSVTARLNRQLTTEKEEEEEQLQRAQVTANTVRQRGE